MPYHRIPRAHIHEDLHAIEHDGEQVVSVEADDEFFHVFTTSIGARLGQIEHRARLGVEA